MLFVHFEVSILRNYYLFLWILGNARGEHGLLVTSSHAEGSHLTLLLLSIHLCIRLTTHAMACVVDLLRGTFITGGCPEDLVGRGIETGLSIRDHLLLLFLNRMHILLGLCRQLI